MFSFSVDFSLSYWMYCKGCKNILKYFEGVRHSKGWESLRKNRPVCSVVKRMLSVREVWGSITGPVKSTQLPCPHVQFMWA